jgi:hypothetical protein
MGGLPRKPPYDALVYGSRAEMTVMADTHVLRHRASRTTGYVAKTVVTNEVGREALASSLAHPVAMVDAAV